MVIILFEQLQIQITILNTNNLHSFILFKMILSDINNSFAIIWF